MHDGHLASAAVSAGELTPEGRRAPILVGLLTFAVPMLLLAAGGGVGEDLRIYRYFGAIAAAGGDPYAAPIGGPVDPAYADMPPLNMAVLALFDGRDVAALQVAFLVALALSAAIVTARRGAGWGLFVGVNPLALVSWVWITEDKPVIVLLAVLPIVLVDRRPAAAGALAVSTAFKFMGAIMAPAFLADVARRDGWRRAGILAAGIGLLVALSGLLWFPGLFEALGHRQDRTALEPAHASLWILAPWAWTPAIVTVVTVAALAGSAWAVWTGRLEVGPAMAAAVFAAYIVAPELGPDRSLAVTVPLLLFVEPTRARLVVAWTAATAAGLLMWVAHFRRPPGGLPLPDDLLLDVAGTNGSAIHAAAMAVVPVLVAGWFVVDARRARVATPRAPAAALRTA